MKKDREFLYTWDHFNFLRNKSIEYSGIVIDDSQYDAFYSLLARRVRALGMKTFDEYCKLLEVKPDWEFNEFINALTSPMSAFFGEPYHFDFLRQNIIPALLKRNRATQSIRTWSIGCSTGEEPYSIAMTLMDNVPKHWDVEVFASDLDTHDLALAVRGIYALERTTGVGEEQLKRWFKKGVGDRHKQVKVKDELQQIVRFKQLNLKEEWPVVGHFDFIFCRNVLLYFDEQTKWDIAKKLADIMPDQSCLFLGNDETMPPLVEDFESVGNTIYKCC